MREREKRMRQSADKTFPCVLNKRRCFANAAVPEPDDVTLPEFVRKERGFLLGHEDIEVAVQNRTENCENLLVHDCPTVILWYNSIQIEICGFARDGVVKWCSSDNRPSDLHHYHYHYHYNQRVIPRQLHYQQRKSTSNQDHATNS